MGHTGVRCFKQVAKLSKTKKLCGSSDSSWDSPWSQLLKKWKIWETVRNNKNAILVIGMFSAQNMWGHLILFLLKAHTYSCWSTETKRLSFKRADHGILANRLVFNSVILVKFAERNTKTNASGIVSPVTFTTWFRSFNLHSRTGRNLTSPLDLGESFKA